MDRRYKKRMEVYWVREKQRSIASIDLLDFNSWFDEWHTHPDWKAKGNRFGESRALVAKHTYELLYYAETRAKSRANDIQLWATICRDTRDNAVYVHTKNPNGTPYPYAFEGVQWGIDMPEELRGVVDLTSHEIGKASYSGEDVYFIRRKA